MASKTGISNALSISAWPDERFLLNGFLLLISDTSTRGSAGEEGETFEELSEYRILAFFPPLIPPKNALITWGYPRYKALIAVHKFHPCHTRHLPVVFLW
jgi:hypothetical protein